ASTDGLLDIGVQLGEAAHGARYKYGVQDIGGEVAHGNIAGRHQGRSVPDDRYDSTEKAEDNKRRKYATVRGALYRDFDDRLERFRIARCFIGFIHKCLDIADALQRLLHHRIRFGQLILRLARQLADEPAEYDRDDHQYR